MPESWLGRNAQSKRKNCGMITDDRTPRLRPHRACKSKVFWHPCSVCGDTNASFGVGYYPQYKKLGTWFCGECFKQQANEPKTERN